MIFCAGRAVDECGGERMSGFTVLPAGGGVVKYFKKMFQKIS